ncbi:hypothetical protein EBT31_00360 [bacterium]|jgi:hypothetical protein|nr:hypothetical protein [bacterium]NBX49708.1 hypothetical protein [bacterium]
MVLDSHQQALLDKAKLAVLREAIDRADTLATVQAQLISTQEQVIQDLRLQIAALQSQVSELKTALSYG